MNTHNVTITWFLHTGKRVSSYFFPTLKYFIPLVLFNLGSIAFAQQKLTGIVTGLEKLPLEGAIISIKGTHKGTITNANGHFTLTAKKGEVLLISSVGYKTQQIEVGDQTYLKIPLKVAVNTLDEIFVTGYTSQRKRDITGSVAVISVKDLKAVPAGSPEQMLQGRSSGLNIITSGQPGSGSNIRIRGITSFGNTEPLVIVDGIQASLTNINANDIESIQVLKDAGAASVYGVRGANGVIIVTTKKGKTGRQL
jgi:TonB-dependent SusC/RagA subfamily outer membrane receptor